MLNKPIITAQLNFSQPGLKEQLCHRHPLYILAGKIHWRLFEESFRKHYREDFGRPAKPIRLMIALLMLKKGFGRRAAIESVIGCLKTDYRLSRNFYKGIKGDNINLMLAAAAMNFKRMINIWKKDFLALVFHLLFFISEPLNPKKIYLFNLYATF
jgi:hypothetical protein